MPEFPFPQALPPSPRSLAAGPPEPPGTAAWRKYYGLDLDGLSAPAQLRIGSFQAGPYRVAAHAWIPEQPDATLILLHGYYDHMGLYRHVVAWGLQMNFAVLACDLPGHGLSDGAPASIGDFAEYQATLDGLFAEARALQLPQPWHLLGQSTGGAIIIDRLLLGETPAELGQSLLLAPLVRPRDWGRGKLSYRLLSPFVKQIPRKFSVNSGDADFIDFVHRRDPLQPKVLPTAWVGALARWIPRIEGAPRSTARPLIVQGDADMTVDWRHNLGVLQDKFDRPELLMLPGGQHHLVNEREALRQRYFDFLRERLG